tara:strand:- start:966 stop:1976 length:1011 start_codon:yes stop_codon:yes gene_type:complete
MHATTRDFKVFGQKWGIDQNTGTPGGLLTYSFAEQNFANQFGKFDSFITQEDFQIEITEALADWEEIANIRFAVSLDSADVDIRFGWRDIDGPNGTLGATTVPFTGALSNVVVAFDINEDWFLSGDAPSGQIDFSSTALHEIGHAIGIDHSDSAMALMNANYSEIIFDLQTDDIGAAELIYGPNVGEKMDVYRYYNPNLGGHFFTADTIEKLSVDQNLEFNGEGVGFLALPRLASDVDGTSPIYRFYNTKLGSHLFTAFEEEKAHVLTLDDFIYEGVAFRAFSTDSSSTVPVHRFFNINSGGHFFTASQLEKETIINMPQLRYEGEAFYAYADIIG